MEVFFQAVQSVTTPSALLAVGVGSVVGLIFGSIPGLTFSMALALMLPVTFSMDAASGMALLVGTYIGGMTGGSVSAILLGIPGTPSAAATLFDGYPLAKAGRASQALGMAVIASVFGGLFSLVVMVFVSNYVAALAIEFGPAEIFTLVIFGMSTICGLAGESLLRGLIAGVIGLMLMVIGLDSMDGLERFTFGSTNLLSGVNLVVGMIGLFAVPQVMNSFLEYGTGKGYGEVTEKVSATLPSWKELKENFWNFIRSAVLGTGIGAIPGTGGPIAAFMAYDQARRFSKNKENFGKGELAGVAAPETANNAVTGGALIPLLTLGIPGDPATAVMLGGLLIHGLRPGPNLFVENVVQVYGIYISFMLSYLVVLVVQLFGIRYLVQVLRIPAHYLAVSILGMCVIGSYAIRNSIFDLYIMALMGLLGYVMQRLRIPVTPVVLGLVLGKILETEYRTALIISDGDHATFYSSVPTVIFLTLTALTLATQLWPRRRTRKG